VYSDHSDQEGGKIIDIDAVSGLGESAPTSLFRDRNVREGKAKAKGEMDGKGKERVAVDSTTQPPGRVKAEPLSPVKRRVRLPDPNQGVLPPVGREDDVMMSDDEDQDRDARGRRVRKTGQIRGVNEAQKVDLSESESEEEGETMEGDFVPAPGYVCFLASSFLMALSIDKVAGQPARQNLRLPIPESLPAV